MLTNLSQTLSIAVGAALVDTINYRLLLLLIVAVVASAAAVPPLLHRDVRLRPRASTATSPSTTNMS